MSQQIQELIDKIQQEGVAQAKAKAAEIESAAQKKANDLVAKARQEAEVIAARAKEEQARFEESMRLGLRQAARDTLLALRTEINQLLKTIIDLQVREALTPETLSAMIVQIAKDEKGDMVVRLSDENLKRLQQGAVAKLQAQLKQKITFQSRDDLRGGLTVSFDAGKSFFDFSDVTLVEYLGGLVSQELAKILDESVKK